VAATIQVEPTSRTDPSGVVKGASARSTACRMVAACCGPASRARRAVGPMRSEPSVAARSEGPTTTGVSKRSSAMF